MSANKNSKSKVKAITKTELRQRLATESGLEPKQIAAVLEGLTAITLDEIKKNGVFQIPGLIKITTIRKPATPERPGVSPFTKQPIIIKAKPARTVVKVRPLKLVKDAVA